MNPTRTYLAHFIIYTSIPTFIFMLMLSLDNYSNFVSVLQPCICRLLEENHEVGMFLLGSFLMFHAIPTFVFILKKWFLLLCSLNFCTVLAPSPLIEVGGVICVFCETGLVCTYKVRLSAALADGLLIHCASFPISYQYLCNRIRRTDVTW